MQALMSSSNRCSTTSCETYIIYMEMENNLKYIVYLTTNLVNKKIYIGVHKTLYPYHFDGYLGNGVKITDRSSYKHSRTPFEAAVNKYGVDNFKRVTLKVFENKQDALDLERWLVDEEFIKRHDTYNITLGGGVPPTNTKTIYQYDLKGNFIKEWESITEASIYYKCSSSSIGKAIFDRTPSCNFLWTEYKYNKIDLETFKIDENKTYTYLYDINGKLINEFKSISNCATYINQSVQKISKAIKGKFCINNQYYCSDIKYDLFPIKNIINHKNDPLYQYDLDGNFIKKWNNYTEVKQYFGKNINIHASIRLNQSCMGFQWSWEQLPNMKKLKPKTKARKVGKYTIDGILINTYNSVREAKKEISSVPSVLSGQRKTAGGFIWKYLED